MPLHEMNDRRRILLLTLIMLLVALSVGFTSIYLLYEAAFEQHRQNLQDTVQGHARLLESIARFNKQHAPQFNQNPIQATLSQVKEAYREYTDPNTSKEYVLGHRKGQVIEILQHSTQEASRVREIPLTGLGPGNPMRRAIEGHSGTLITHDFRNVTVLAAYEYVKVMDMGVVIKMDLAEIRSPFIETAGWLGVISLCLIILGVVLFSRISGTILGELAKKESRYRNLMDNMTSGAAIFEAVDQGSDFVFVDFNHGAEKIERMQKDEIIGKRVTEVFPGVRKFGLLEVFQQVWHTGEPAAHPVSFYEDDRLAGWRDNYIYRLESGEIVAVYSDLTQQKQADAAIQTLMESTVGLTGHAYFDKVAQELCRWSGADCAYIGEIIPENRVQALAQVLDGNKIKGHSYELSGTPCNEVVEQGPCHYPEAICGLFPDDPDLILLEAHGYAGTPIRDSDNQVLGVLWLISRRPLRLPPQWKSIFEILAARTGAEIERMRAETSKRENMQRFRALVESTQDFVWEVDAHGVYTYCSPQIHRILGYTPEELTGRTPFDFMSPDEAKRTASTFASLCAEMAPFTSLENTNLHKDGQEVIFDTSGVPFFDEAGHLAGFRGIDRDITHRKQSEKLLRESEQRFRELIESLPNVAVQGYDKEHRVIYWNDTSRRLYGYTKEEAIGTRLEELIIPEPMVEPLTEALDAWLNEGQKIPPGELELKHKDGGTVSVYSSHVLLRQDTDEPEIFSIDVDLSEQKRTQAKLEHLATFDQLTKLPNRYQLNTELNQRLLEADRFKQKIAILFIDLDNFKLINDSMGHEAGDILLQQVAQRLTSHLRQYDTLARFGGDEFILMMPQVRETSEVVTVADKLLHSLSTPFELLGQKTFASCSIGISLFPDDGRNVGELLQNADTAMYRAKESGRNQYQFFTQSMNNALRRQHRIATRLRISLANQDFQLHYQPQVDMESGEINSCEALLRWFPSDREIISPAEFIPVAENSELINHIGEWVLNEACRQKAEWKKLGMEDLRIDINLSGRQLGQRSIFDLFNSTLKRHGLLPADIGIELTENVLIQADESILSHLKSLQSEGMHISIDDFGTGYSSLSYVKRFPVSSLKIDQTFVRDAVQDQDDRSIMQAIVAMGHSLGLTVVVEGIETVDQYILTKEMGCDLAQGFLFYKPMPADQLLERLSQQPRFPEITQGPRVERC